MFFKTSRILIFIAFIAIYIIWGSTYLLNKVVVTELPPFFLASIRFLTAGISMITIAAIFLKHLEWLLTKVVLILKILTLTSYK